MNKMKRTFAIIAVVMMTALSVQAQKITVVDDDGHGIPLVSVSTEDGTLIGTTDLNGVLANTKGAAKVVVTHVAFKPQVVSVASLTDGRIQMEAVDYGLEEIVVRPKPYVYMEYFFRGFSYIDDSLRTYAAGIIPVAHEISNGYKGKTRNVWSHGGAANKALVWNVSDLALTAEEGAKRACRSIETLVRRSERFKDYYKVSMEKDGEKRWILKNPEGEVGQFLHDDGVYRATLDGGKMQIYANKVNGEEKMQKRREEKNYDYQYTEVFNLDDEGLIQPYNFVMLLCHWEHDSSKGRKITLLYLYAIDHSYMDYDEFKARSKELNKGYSGDMPLDVLEEYARAHNVPDLAPAQLQAIQELKLQTGRKNK